MSWLIVPPKSAARVNDLALPEGCVGVAGEVGDYPLLNGEEVFVERAVAKRRREFATGRHFARLALQQLGQAPAAILRDDDRRPIWPQGNVGSISHTECLAAAVVASAKSLRGAGIDIEYCDRVTEELQPRLLTEHEMTRSWHDEREPAVIFSAKEAGYKAINPIVGEFIGFQAAEIDLDWTQGRFAIRYVGEHAPNRLLETGEGQFCFIDQQVVTLFFIG